MMALWKFTSPVNFSRINRSLLRLAKLLEFVEGSELVIITAFDIGFLITIGLFDPSLGSLTGYCQVTDSLELLT